MGVNRDELKRQAAERAVEFIESGMVVGLGHGSTAIHAVRKIGQLIQNGTLTNIVGVPCSAHIELEAQNLGIPLTTLEAHPVIDITIDGADEVDPALNLIKGGGGALLREKIVAQATRREIIAVDDSKISDALGIRWSVPIEVVAFGHGSQQRFLESLGAEVLIRRKEDGSLFLTDQGNFVFDCNFGRINDPYQLGMHLNGRAGIVEHGLFLSIAADVIVAGENGIQHLKREG